MRSLYSLLIAALLFFQTYNNRAYSAPFLKATPVLQSFFDMHNGSTSTINYDFQIENIKNNHSLQVNFHTCIKHTEQLERHLLNILHNLYSHLHYWQEQKIRPNYYFFHKNPLKWFSSTKQHEEIEQAIATLQQKIAHYACYLGFLKELFYQKNTITSYESLKKYVYCLSLFINNCLQDEKFSPHIGEESPHNIDAQSALLIDKNTKLINHYATISLRDITMHAQPSYLTRHWLEYGIGGLCALGSYYYWSNNKEPIKTKFEQLCKSIEYLYREKGYKPIKNVLNIIYNQEKDDATNLIDIVDEQQVQEAIKAVIQNREDTEKELISLYREIYAESYNNIPPDQVEEKIKKAISTRTVTEEIPKEIMQQDKHPIWNSVAGNLVKHKQIKGYTVGLIGLDVSLIGLNAVLKAQKVISQEILNIQERYKINFELGMMLPIVVFSALTCYTGYRCIKYVGNKLYTIIIPSQLKKIKQALITIERILNIYYIQKMDYSTQGKLHYWIYQLLSLTPHIAKEYQKNFYDDLTELNEPTMNMHQKRETIMRMYRTYPFLSN